MTQSNRDLTWSGGTLTEAVHGAVRTRTAEDYDAERGGFQLLSAHRPDVIVTPAGTDDVVSAVRFAASTGGPIVVQATGHGLSNPLDGDGVLIATHRMRSVTVDPSTSTAWVEAGATWRDVIDAAAPHGLAPLSGSLPGVGAVSYTLGGGTGVMARRYGFSADHVRRIDVVTPDGKLRAATPTDDAELFWGLRGGGGNFGVVTGMEIELMPVRHLYGGGLVFDMEQTPQMVEAWYRWTANLPEEVSSAVSMLTFPDVEWAPEPMRGRHIGQIQIAYLGSPSEGDELLRPMRALGPMIDGIQQIPFSQSEAVFNEPDEPHAYQGQCRLLDDVDESRVPSLVKVSGPSNSPMCIVGLRHLGGALSRPPETPNAVGHRSARYLLGVLSPVLGDEVRALHTMHRDVLDGWSDLALGCSLNFSFGSLDEASVRSAYDPDDYRRLSTLKARVDPDGLIRSNFPIPATWRP